MKPLFGPGKSYTCSVWLLAGTLLVALLHTQTANAQSAEGAPAPTTDKNRPAGDADFQDAIHRVEQLTRDLRQQVAVYQEHLQRAMENYGHGFYDPDYHQKLAGFDREIRTGDPHKLKRSDDQCSRPS
jgi:hypothetical protein